MVFEYLALGISHYNLGLERKGFHLTLKYLHYVIINNIIYNLL